MLPLLILATMASPKELDAYLKTADRAYEFTATPVSTPGRTDIELTSGTWHGTTWKHRLLLQQPPKIDHPGVGILYITGDGPTNGDLSTLTLLAGATGMPVSMLFDIPNQPLWDKREDDLIAYTFEKYLETGDATWPLLFPMTRAALRAMDAIEKATERSNNPIKKFVVCGASKRGWTTWLVGAARDKRVIGIAPMVIDNLNLPAQMPHQIQTWGEYSAQIQDYTRRGLQAKMATPAGQKLASMVDPYSYRDRIEMPTLIIRGSNDEYWTADALDQYEPGLKMPHWFLAVPNAGHDLKGGLMAAESIGAFARSLAGEFPMPDLRWSFDPGTEPHTLVVGGTSYRTGYTSLRVWMAESDTLDFRKSTYRLVAHADTEGGDPRKASAPGKPVIATNIHALLPEGRNAAVFAEARYKIDGREFSLSSPTKIYRK